METKILLLISWQMHDMLGRHTCMEVREDMEETKGLIAQQFCWVHGIYPNKFFIGNFNYCLQTGSPGGHTVMTLWSL